MIGSLPRIWPFQHADLSSIVLQKGKPVATRIVYDMPQSFDGKTLFTILCAIAGLGLVMGIEYYAKKVRKNQEQ